MSRRKILITDTGQDAVIKLNQAEFDKLDIPLESDGSKLVFKENEPFCLTFIVDKNEK